MQKFLDENGNRPSLTSSKTQQDSAASRQPTTETHSNLLNQKQNTNMLIGKNSNNPLMRNNWPHRTTYGRNATQQCKYPCNMDPNRKDVLHNSSGKPMMRQRKFYRNVQTTSTGFNKIDNKTKEQEKHTTVHKNKAQTRPVLDHFMTAAYHQYLVLAVPVDHPLFYPMY